MTAPTTFPGTAPVPPKTVRTASWLVALAVPLAYLFLYVPVGMDTTDFGYFYGFSWRILEGQFPYRDFFYIKPSLPLFWHARRHRSARRQGRLPLLHAGGLLVRGGLPFEDLQF